MTQPLGPLPRGPLSDDDVQSLRRFYALPRTERRALEGLPPLTDCNDATWQATQERTNWLQMIGAVIVGVVLTVLFSWLGFY